MSSGATGSARGDAPSSGPSPWLDILPAVLSAVGVVLFGFLSIGYSEFYGRLGTTPEAVGFSYASTLAHSASLVVLVAVLAALAARYYIRRRLKRQLKQIADDLRSTELESAKRESSESSDAVQQAASKALAHNKQAVESARALTESPNPETRALGERILKTYGESAESVRSAASASAAAQRGSNELVAHVTALSDAVGLTERERRIGIGLLTGAIVGGILLLTIPLLVGPRADRAAEGQPVDPIRIAGITLLDVTAHRSRVEPAGDVAKSPTIDALSERDLLYLGQSAGTLVLFDPEIDRALYVPASSAIVRVAP